MLSTQGIILLAALLLSARATVITVDHECEDSNSAMCEVKELRVTPCAAAKGVVQRCKLKGGTNATIEFDFIPHFNADKISTLAYASVVADIPMPGMDQDGCKRTKCPIKSGTKSRYTNIMEVHDLFPAGSYNVKFRLWDEKDEKKSCCVALKIAIL